MSEIGDEEELLRAVTLKNASSILIARQRAEEELLRAKDTLELKTAELARSLALVRATLESTTDGILVTDRTGNVTSLNENYLALWRLDRERTESANHRGILEVIYDQFKHPERAVRRIEEIYLTSPAESFDLLELADGRFIERFSKVQLVDERNVGRVWSFRDITERRRAEEMVHKQSEWLRVTLASIGDAVITTDTEGRVSSLNPVAEHLTGWTEQDAKGQPLERVFTIVNEHTRQPGENPALHSLREGRIVGLANHTLLVAKDGTDRAIDDSAAPIRDELGRTIGVVLVFRDVTESRRDAERIRQSEAQFRQLADAQPQIVWRARPDGFIDHYNERWYEFTGFQRGEYGDESWKPILHPDDERRTVDTYYESIRTGNDFEIEYRFKDRKTGGFRWFLGRAYPVRDEEGRIVRWFGTSTDIHDTKKSEQTTRFLADASAALAELMDYESTLQQVAGLAVPFFADLSVVDLLEADGSVRRLAATHSDPAKVRLASELVHNYRPLPSDPLGIMKVLRTGVPDWISEIPDSLLQEAAQDAGHLKMLREMGLKSFICVPLESRGKTIGALTFATAESGRVYGLEDVRAGQDLAHRTVIAIENATLLSTLKESDRLKDEFLAMLAHELRNPLAPIRNAVQIFRGKGPPVPELQWATEVIDRQVQQMTRLVDDLLDVSRITRGKLELRKERVELAAVVKMAVEAARPLIEKWQHELTVTLPPEPIYVDADPTRLAQVLMNLLNNAVKYTEEAGRISLIAALHGDRVVIRVKDTGVGIPADLLRRVFDLFTQVDRSLERSQGGLGIGLTLVQRLVEMHGGSVEARSDGPGKGSEFVVRLPIAEEGKGQLLPTIDGDGGRLAVHLKLRILVVDDNRDAANSLGMLLRMIGNEVHTAHDGLEAVGAAATFQPDVVLLDIGLPKLNGYEAARRIREQHRGGRLTMIALTGWGQEEDRRRSREAGFDHHMTKPVDFEGLKKLLAET